MTRSPTNLALPVTFSMPSTLGTLCPTYFSCRLAIDFQTSKNCHLNLTKPLGQFKKAMPILDSYPSNVQQNNFHKIYRAKTQRRKVKNSFPPNLASLRESCLFRF